MNLKLKRLVRTPSSEQYALFDLDQVGTDGKPLTIGKLDLHYTGEGVYGTALLWDEASRTLPSAVRQQFMRALLNELTQPMGVPSEFVIEFFTPKLEDYELFHNVGVEEEEEMVSEAEVIPEVSADTQPVSIEELEEELLKEERSGSNRSFTFLIILGLVAAVIIVGYIFYQKGKKGAGDIFME